MSIDGREYTIGQSQYVKLEVSGDHVVVVESNRSIVMALVHYGDAYNDTYITEIIPVDWYSSGLPVPYAARNFYAIDENVRVRVYAINRAGACGAVEAMDRNFTISDSRGNTIYPGDDVVLYEYIQGDYETQHGSALIAVYDTSKWNQYFNQKIGAWVMVYLIPGVYTRGYRTVVSLMPYIELIAVLAGPGK